jgi:hypothetical protein
MKKIFFVALLSIVVIVAQAQPPQGQPHSRLNVYGAYAFPDSYSSYYNTTNYYDGKVDGGFQYGVGFEYMIHSHNCVELMYLHEDTKAPTHWQDGGISPNKGDFDLHFNYLMIGSDGHKASASGKVEGYGGIFLGAAFVSAENPDTHNTGNATKFAWGIRAGVNIWANEKFGIKLQTQLLSIAQGAGGGLYFGTGGAGVGVSTYSTIYQFCLGGGICFRFGK